MCGQENTDPRESLWSIITHFFNDITHFDGKFFKTSGMLLSKPGFLPLEFIRGRRASYLHPIRLYIFTSAVFFIIFYSISTPEIGRGTNTNSTEFTIGTASDIVLTPLDTIVAVSGRNKPYATIAEYDSVQRTLPVEKRDGWITRKMIQRNIERRKKYGGRNEAMVTGIFNNFIHSFPYLLFVSLPISAFFLQLLFMRNRNNIYAGHTMFLIYLYVFTFLILLTYFGLESLQSAFGWNWIGYIEFALFAYLFFYSLIAMKVYYAEGWGRTIFKFMVFNFLAFISILILFVIFFLLSLFKV